MIGVGRGGIRKGRSGKGRGGEWGNEMKRKRGDELERRGGEWGRESRGWRKRYRRDKMWTLSRGRR